MASATRTTDPADGRAADLELDAVVVGAGVAGLYQLHQLRELGLRVRAYDAAEDIGGTWWWHGYPGARVDSEGYVYQYLFSEQLYKQWSWSERFPAGYEVLRWLRFLADRLDLRRDIQLSTRIVSAHYDEGRGRWTIRTDRGETIDTQFFVSCAGTLSAPTENLFEGQDSFTGPVLDTSRWPQKAPELAGMRVGVVGVGATAVQLIPRIVDKVGHLTVFAGTPPYLLPMKNPVYGWQDREGYKARFQELKETIPHTYTDFEYDSEHVWAEKTPEERRAILEELYQDGSLKLWLASFGDPFFVDEASEFVRDKMRERLSDPRLIDVLVPTDDGFGTHRVPLKYGYLEVYHRDDVELVAVKANPIARIRPEGIELTDGTVHELDVIVLASGSDAGTGALTRIDIRGRDGRSLAEEWGRDTRTTMGLAKHGYPNLLTTAMPLAPSAALCNMTTCLQQQTEWITDAVRDMRAHGKSTIEPTKAGEDAWVAHHEETAGATPIANTTGWHLGSTVPGTPRRILSYTGGVGTYRQKCEEEAAGGYPAFTRT